MFSRHSVTQKILTYRDKACWQEYRTHDSKEFHVFTVTLGSSGDTGLNP
jgi:hypothetical protein